MGRSGPGKLMDDTFRKTSLVLAAIALWIAVAALAFAVRKTILMVVFAMLFAYLLEPVVVRFERWLKSRGWAIAVTYILLLGLLALLFATAGPRLASEARKLGQAAPDWFAKLQSGQIAWQIGSKHGWSYETQQRLQNFLASHHQQIIWKGREIAGQAALVAGKITWLILVPILAIFFLRDKWAFASSVITLAEESRQRRFIRNVLIDLDRMLSRYVRAQLLLAMIATVAYVSFFLIMRLPYGSVLGTTAGMLEFIPFVGPLITAVLVGSTAFLTGYKHWLIVIVFLGVWRLIQDYVNAPRIIGKRLELHPLVAIVSILAGGEIGGVLLNEAARDPISRPLITAVSTLRIIWNNWQARGASRESPVRKMDDQAA